MVKRKMNIRDIEEFGKTQNIKIAKIILIKQDDSRKILLAPKSIICQIIEQSVEQDGKGKLYILDNLASEWLKNDKIDLPIKFSTVCK